jgi:uncharacterized membrane protein
MTVGHSQRHYAHKGSDMSRLIGLSDGLFATVLTLLVLEIKLPASVPSADVMDGLVQLWPKMFSYLLTFLVAGVYWVSHHYDFEHIVRFDRRLMWMNLMFLLCIGVLPVTTALVGTHDIEQQPLVWIVYALNMALGGVMQAAVWGYAATHHMVDPTLHPDLIRYVILRHLVAPGVFLLSVGLTLVVPGRIVSMSPMLISPAHTLLSRVCLGSGRAADEADEEEQPATWDMLWRVVTLLPLIGFAGWSVWVWLVYGRG